MRVTRFLLLLLTVAMAGCAAQRVVYVPAAAPASQNGIDAVTYGTTGAYAPPSQYPSGYAQSYASPYSASPYGASRGLFQSNSAYPAGYARSYAPAYSPAAAVSSAGPSAPTAAPSASPHNYVSGAIYAYAPGAAASSAPPANTQSAYTLDSGDRLRVVVFGQDGLTNSYAVDAGGHIDMPLIGSVTARGETTDALASRVADKLRNGYVRDPHVAVEIEAYRPFFILGEVTQPGQYPYVANMTAETAVAIAGGFSPRAYRQSVILNRSQNGQPMRMTVPLTYPLRPGDTINVQERWF